MKCKIVAAAAAAAVVVVVAAAVLCVCRMAGCDLTYGLETVSNASIVENFLPSYRTFKIFPLKSNTTYWLYMTCKAEWTPQGPRQPY